jgi:hypothetical protein
MSDDTSPCGACNNLDAYWEERARHDPNIRARLLHLERQSDRLRRGADPDEDEREDCPDDCAE